MSNKEMTKINIFYVPSNIIFDDLTEKVVENETHQLVMCYPKISEQEIKKITKIITHNRNHYLKHLTVNEIIDIIARAAEKWTNPAYHFRKIAEKAVPMLTGYDVDQFSLEIKNFIRLFRKKELKRFVNSELGQSGTVLNDFQPNLSGGFSKFYGPDLIFQIFSGNVPGIQLWTLIMGLLVKSPTLGKTSFAEPIMPALFVQTLAEIDPKLADTIAIMPWHSGETFEKHCLDLADTIIVCGSKETVTSVKSKASINKRILSYGYKIGLAIVGRETLTPDRYVQVIKDLVEDITTYDQQSCLAPQSIFIERGGAITPQEFASILSNELDNYQIKYPRAPINESDKIAIERMRQEAEITSIKNEAISLFRSDNSTAWTVILHNKIGFSASPLNRSIHIFMVDDLTDLPLALTPYQQYLQSAGIAVSPNRLFLLADILGKVGVNRMSALGKMNHVSSGWHHDGHFNLLDLVRVTDIEQSLECYSEQFDPDVE
ncbi:acyl-CoA reductase [Leuconostoc mesenteroides]